MLTGKFRARTTSFLQSIDEDVWNSVEFGYSKPAVQVDGNLVPKPREQWTNEEKHASNYNSKAINAIYNGVSPS